MLIEFYKYHGNGNDFICLDSRSYENDLFLSVKTIQMMCNRNTGIGADGILCLTKHKKFDFEMKYYNSDGSSGMMCGNGGRCIVKFAEKIGVIKSNRVKFLGPDGDYDALINGDVVKIKMRDVNEVTKTNDCYILNTGTMHYVKLVDDVNEIDVDYEGRKIRNSFRNGINVNFLNIYNNMVRTYEKGLEKETLSCGTGAVASAIVISRRLPNGKHNVTIEMMGGIFKIIFNKIDDTHFRDIWLEGDTKFVFSGLIIV